MDQNPFLPKPKPDRWRWARSPWTIVVAAVVIAAAVLVFSMNRIMTSVLHSQPEVVVPALEGGDMLEALATVSKLDLSLKQDGTEFDETLPAGTILRQSPPAGMKVRAGRAIRVVVSKGGRVVFVPYIVGRPLAEAQSVLAVDGLQIGSVTEVYSTEFQKSEVVSQSPSSGTVVTRGALVHVEASRGLPPAGAPMVPDFFGQNADAVNEWALGVNAKVRLREDAAAVGVAGTVVRQHPAAGQPLLEGETLAVTIVPLLASQGSRVNYQVPSEMGEVTVRIVARDNRGESEVYRGKHAGGGIVEIPISVSAPTRVRIYVDDILQEERVVEP